MNSHRRNWLAWITAVGLLSATGCAAPKRSGWRWPWQPYADNTIGITTPAERMAEMHKLAEQAPKQTPEERERISSELAKEIQDEQDPLVRRHIVRTLGYYNTASSNAVLEAAVADADAQVRIAACEAWGRRGGKQAVETLTGLLTSDTNLDVRLAAGRAIGDTKDPSAVGPLAEALTDSNPAIQYRVTHSLKQISGKDFGNSPDLWRAYAKGESVKEPSISVAQRLKSMF